MANLWDNLSGDERQQLLQTYLGQQGNKSNENANRAKEQLINNPKLVERLAKDAGLTDAEDDFTMQEHDDGEEEGIEEAVGRQLEEVDGDMQATGGLSQAAIPPAEQGESMEDYINRLSSLGAGPNGPRMVENDNAGQRNKLTGREIAKMPLVPSESSDPNDWTNQHFAFPRSVQSAMGRDEVLSGPRANDIGRKRR